MLLGFFMFKANQEKNSLELLYIDSFRPVFLSLLFLSLDPYLACFVSFFFFSTYVPDYVLLLRHDTSSKDWVFALLKG